MDCSIIIKKLPTDTASGSVRQVGGVVSTAEESLTLKGLESRANTRAASKEGREKSPSKASSSTLQSFVSGKSRITSVTNASVSSSRMPSIRDNSRKRNSQVLRDSLEESESGALGNPASGKEKPKRKKKGRPAIHSDHEGKFTAEERAKKERRKKDIAEHLAILEIQDSDVEASENRRYKTAKEAELNLLSDYKELPATDVSAIVMEEVETIRKIVQKSSNIKGELKGMMYAASERIGAANITLAKRLREANPDQSATEMEELRNEFLPGATTLE